ncbi:MAG TPA: pilus assembly protein TadG-related protein [Bryobacteraceae bacterium]|nr:pilus assembly protein TadG-related protein [Bryobacteraceae bacterium]
MRHRKNRKRGQILVMVTLALFMMAGIMGLAVDLGWSYFTKKSAQTAADAAALAAAEAAFAAESDEDANSTYDCGTEVACVPLSQCPSPIPNPPTNNIEVGCLYAKQNGFQVQPGGRQNVTMNSGNTPNPPTVPGVTVYYWATARVAEGIPQLFSSMLGNTLNLASARATGAIIDSTIAGSLILLNRERDCVPMNLGSQPICGVDLLVQANNNQGMDAVRADGGVLMASVLNGTNDPSGEGNYSGENQGGGLVRAPFTFIRGDGTVSLGGSSQWIQSPTNGFSDRSYFRDPMRGKGSPPPPAPGLQDIPIMGGALMGSNDPNNPTIYSPGNYYAVKQVGGTLVPTGDPLTMSGYLKFQADSDGFGDWVFFGGLRNQSAGTVMTVDPGRYVIAGVRSNGNNVTPGFDIQVNMSITDNGPPNAAPAPSNAGEIFIFTDPTYLGGPAGDIPLTIPVALQNSPVLNDLKFGISGFQTGNNADIQVNIHGLNRDSGALPAELKDFTPVVMWQDQQNSVIQYTPRGYIDNSCGNLDPQQGCANSALDNAASTEMFFKASPSLHIYGTVYQPRGAFTSMIGAGGYDSPLMIIAGALMVHANSNVRLQELDSPLYVKMVALVE